MSMYYDYPGMDAAESLLGGVAGFALVFFLVFYLLMFAFCILSYVLTSLGMYTIAKRRGIYNAWLSWIPVGSVWIMGSISDQYQYVVKGKVCNRRKVLLGLSIATLLMIVPVIFGAILAATGTVGAGVGMAIILLAYLAMVVLSIILMVFEYITLYDLFASCNPSNAVLYLVLTILVGVVLPFFVFSCRNKDLGMIPQRPAQPVQQIPVQNPEPDQL